MKYLIFVLVFLSLETSASSIKSLEEGTIMTFFHRVQMDSQVSKVPFYQEGIEREQNLFVDVLRRDGSVLEKGYVFDVGDSFMLRALESEKGGKQLSLRFMNMLGLTLRIKIKSTKGEFLSQDEFKEAFDGVASFM